VPGLQGTSTGAKGKAAAAGGAEGRREGEPAPPHPGGGDERWSGTEELGHCTPISGLGGLRWKSQGVSVPHPDDRSSSPLTYGLLSVTRAHGGRSGKETSSVRGATEEAERTVLRGTQECLQGSDGPAQPRAGQHPFSSRNLCFWWGGGGKKSPKERQHLALVPSRLSPSGDAAPGVRSASRLKVILGSSTAAQDCEKFSLFQGKSLERQPSAPGGGEALPGCREVGKSWVPAKFSSVLT